MCDDMHCHAKYVDVCLEQQLHLRHNLIYINILFGSLKLHILTYLSEAYI